MISESSVSARAAQKARTRQALLDAAVGVIRERGLEATTARAISERAGVATGTFFVHFPEVSDLVEELLDESIARSLDRAYRSVRDDGSIVDVLVHVADALFAGYASEPHLARSFIAATIFRVDGDGPSARRLTGFRVWVLERLRRARAAGEIGPHVDLDDLFAVFFSLYVGLVIGGLRGDIDRAAQRRLLRVSLGALIGESA